MRATPSLEIIGILSEKQLGVGEDIVKTYRQDFKQTWVKPLQEQIARDFQGGMQVTVNEQKVGDVSSYQAKMTEMGASPLAIAESLYLLHQGIVGPAFAAVTMGLLPSDHTLRGAGEAIALSVTVRNQEVVLEAEAKYDVCRMPNDTHPDLQKVGEVALVTRVGNLGSESPKALLVEVHADQPGAQVVQPLLPPKQMM